MKHRSRVMMSLAVAAVLCAALALSACGSRDTDEPEDAQVQTEAVTETEAAAGTEAAPETQAAPETEAASQTEAAPAAETGEEATSGAASGETPAAPADDPYVGTYVETAGQRATMQIEYYEGSYYVTVDWPSSAEEHAQWTFHGHFDEDGVMEFFNGLKTVTQPDDSGDLIPVLGYNYGAGTIRMTAEGIVWDDEQEHVADGLVFARQ